MEDVENKVNFNLKFSLETPSDSSHSLSDEDDENAISYEGLMESCNRISN